MAFDSDPVGNGFVAGFSKHAVSMARAGHKATK
jgi:hypothetical protein